MQNLPEEVLLPPKPYVALLGDLEYVEILAVSLKTAGGPRPGGPSTMYMRYEPYPLSKRFTPRQRSHGEHEYPSYIPAGILRSNWMKKHQDEVPAVIALVFPMAVRTSRDEWRGVEAAAITALTAVQEYARGRGNEIQLILVQTDREAVVGGGRGLSQAAASEERALESELGERVTALRKRSGLDAGSVSVLYKGDVSGASMTLGASTLVAALDVSLREKARVYYRARARRCKSLLDTRSGLTTQPMQRGLRARLLFKLAHFSEFRGKPHKAVKYYGACGAALGEFLDLLGPTHSLITQAKSVAEWCNFKLMRAYLGAGSAQVPTPTGLFPGTVAAVAQFQRHLRKWEGGVDRGGGGVGAATHCAWLQQQYTLAAELLQQNLPRPTPDTPKNQTPEHYLHTAALYAIKRRKGAQAGGLRAEVGGGLGEAGVAAVGQCGRVVYSPPPFVGCPPRATAYAPTPTTPTPPPLPAGEAEALTVAGVAARECQVGHSEGVLALLEKAQKVAVVDGGAGGAPRLLHKLSGGGSGGNTSGSSGGGGEEKETSYSPSSCFSFILAPGFSRARLWRQWLLAEELMVMGSPLPALQLLLPVASALRDKPWTPGFTASVEGCLAKAATLVMPTASAGGGGGGGGDGGDAPTLGFYALATSASLECMSAAALASVTGSPCPVTALEAFGRMREALSGMKGGGGGEVEFQLPPPSSPLTLPFSPLLKPSPSSSSSSSSSSTTTSSIALPALLAKTLANSPSSTSFASAFVTFSHPLATPASTVTARVTLCGILPTPLFLSRLVCHFSVANGDVALSPSSVVYGGGGEVVVVGGGSGSGSGSGGGGGVPPPLSHFTVVITPGEEEEEEGGEVEGEGRGVAGSKSTTSKPLLLSAVSVEGEENMYRVVDGSGSSSSSSSSGSSGGSHVRIAVPDILLPPLGTPWSIEFPLVLPSSPRQGFSTVGGGKTGLQVLQDLVVLGAGEAAGGSGEWSEASGGGSGTAAPASGGGVLVNTRDPNLASTDPVATFMPPPPPGGASAQGLPVPEGPPPLSRAQDVGVRTLLCSSVSLALSRGVSLRVTPTLVTTRSPHPSPAPPKPLLLTSAAASSSSTSVVEGGGKTTQQQQQQQYYGTLTSSPQAILAALMSCGGKGRIEVEVAPPNSPYPPHYAAAILRLSSLLPPAAAHAVRVSPKRCPWQQYHGISHTPATTALTTKSSASTTTISSGGTSVTPPPSVWGSVGKRGVGQSFGRLGGGWETSSSVLISEEGPLCSLSLSNLAPLPGSGIGSGGSALPTVCSVEGVVASSEVQVRVLGEGGRGLSGGFLCIQTQTEKGGVGGVGGVFLPPTTLCITTTGETVVLGESSGGGSGGGGGSVDGLGGFVPLHPGILGVVIPPLSHASSSSSSSSTTTTGFTLPLKISQPSPSARLAQLHSATHPTVMCTFRVHGVKGGVVVEDAAPSSSSSPISSTPSATTASALLALLQSSPHLYTTASTTLRCIFPTPLSILSASIEPDPCAPLVDLSPFLHRQAPFSRLCAEGGGVGEGGGGEGGGMAAAAAAASTTPATRSMVEPLHSLLPIPPPTPGAHPIIGHVRCGTKFSFALTLMAGGGERITIHSATLASTVLQGGENAVAGQLGFAPLSTTTTNSTSTSTSSASNPLFAAVAQAMGGSQHQQQGGRGATSVSPREEIRLLFTGSLPQGTSGVFELGTLTVAWSPASHKSGAPNSSSSPSSTTMSHTITLPRVAVHDPPLVCDITLPPTAPPTPNTQVVGAAAQNTSASATGPPPPLQPLPLSIRVTNRSPHFQAVEATVYIPGSIPYQPASPTPGALFTPYLPHLPLLPSTSSVHVLELLPGAGKTAVFQCSPRPPTHPHHQHQHQHPHLRAPVALPTVTLRAVEPRLTGQIPPPLPTPGGAYSGILTEGTLPPERRTLLAVQPPPIMV